jgi:hypothetical protein
VPLSRQGQPRRRLGCGIGPVSAFASSIPLASVTDPGSGVEPAAASAPVATIFSTRAMQRDRSGPTELARISNVERRMPSRSSYSLVWTCPATITGEPLPSDAPTPETRRPQQLTVTNSELPGSQVPSAARRRELLATRNFSTSWSPTLRRIGSLTMFPTTVGFDGSSSLASHRAPARPSPPRDRRNKLKPPMVENGCPLGGLR